MEGSKKKKKCSITIGLPKKNLKNSAARITATKVMQDLFEFGI